MTRIESAPTLSPVRLHDHWRDPVRVEANNELTLKRAANVLTHAGYLITASLDDRPGSRQSTFFCDDDFGDVCGLLQVLIRAGISAEIGSITRPTPAEEEEDEAAWQEEEALMEAEAKQPAPEVWAPF